MEYDYFFGEDKMGMTITSGCVTLRKDNNNLIGISIGGGAPHCPCLYIIFDNTTASFNGSLASGDEVTAVNKQCVKGMSKIDVAKLIQSVSEEVTIHYNKLHADPKQGKTLDIILKKVKHRIVEKMSSSTADVLGLSRAILCNDSLVKKMEELNRNEKIYRGMIILTRKLLKAIFCCSQNYKTLGEIFCKIGVKEPQKGASQAFTQFGKIHKEIEAYGMQMLKKSKLVLIDLGTFLTKAIPDTKLTIKKYADAKFEYLSYCLKVKEMDDEEYTFMALNEPLYRIETGNYEYRLILRCRQEARIKFSKLRGDVMEKIELLDQKYLQDLINHLKKLIIDMEEYHYKCYKQMKSLSIFPIEIDLSNSMFLIQSNNTVNSNDQDEGDDIINLSDHDELITNIDDVSLMAYDESLVKDTYLLSLD
ncbi:PRKCA-binding protein-like isoform X2 [Gordionus sp. m RMFG-2023]|uniref:PRKCA-binding protein-like isoform X2 n=1 Tax=Gordionus sp. m RMFG-2023 TaxID=3053472 RepID=UPI0031FBEC53